MRRRFLLAPALLALTSCAPDPEPVPTPDPVPETDVSYSDLRAFSEEQVACLARAAYHEARGEGRRGMAAVVHVVLNRAEAPAYPDQPCAVVNQGAETASNGRCQFSWACDGKPDTPNNLVAYDRALDVARAAAAGDLADPTEGAVMFHARTVDPYWTSAAEKTAEIGSHVFYKLDE